MSIGKESGEILDALERGIYDDNRDSLNSTWRRLAAYFQRLSEDRAKLLDDLHNLRMDNQQLATSVSLRKNQTLRRITMSIGFGKIAYDAYREQSGGKSLVSGQPIPEWPNLPDDIRAAWDAAGDAVAEECAQICNYYSLDSPYPYPGAYGGGARRGAVECAERIVERKSPLGKPQAMRGE